MKHIEDIQINDIEISIYQNSENFYIDIKNQNGEIIQSRILEKQETNNKSIKFDKVVKVYLDPELMEMLNKQTGIDEFETDNWCDKHEFEKVPSIYEFITEEQKQAITNDEIDYIVFRIDR